jgi:sulfur relay (sulfurtransferase) DsrC/TusE family protein
MKIYIVKLESNVDGEFISSAVPCRSLEAAKKVLKREKETIMKESRHFSNMTKDDLEDSCEITDEPEHFEIIDLNDSYWEDYTIDVWNDFVEE